MYPQYIIYRIYNTVNGKCYIGCTKRTLKKRLSGHYSAMKQNNNHPLYKDMRKYGKDKFKVETILKGKDEWILEGERAHHHSNFKRFIFEWYFQHKFNSFFPYGYNKQRGKKFLKLPIELLDKESLEKIKQIIEDRISKGN